VRTRFQGGDDLVKAPFRRKDEPVTSEPVEEMPVTRTTARSEDEPVEDVSFDALRTGFTASVSHELRTPLGRIMVLLDSADLPDADVHALIDQAKAEVNNAAELIDEILFLSELESGREVVSLGRTVVMPVLEQVLEEHEPGAARAGVMLAADGEETLDVPLRTRMLHIVAQNLTENAIRYAGHGATFMLTITREPEATVLTAADDGIGVSESDMPRLFERFWRADSARSSRGTGLGLAIVKRIVLAAGGSVEATGGRGAGLRIRCVFPDHARSV
jgi:signal transduction histidine kinase